jgi:hypothetical protein
MMAAKRLAGSRLVSIGIIVILLAAMYPLQGQIEATRKEHKFSINPLKDLPAGEFFGTVLLGGFRAIAVDLIWMKAKEAENNHDWHRLYVLNRLIASLQPRFIQVWNFNMWKMAYNLSVAAPTDREGWQWVKKGIEFGKEGFERNPDSWRLAWYIGHHYFHRCGSINDERTGKYQRWLFEETGKTNWQHALYWFLKSYEVSNRRSNPNWLGMVPTVYRQMAYEAEENGDLEATKKHRLEAIVWLYRIMDRYPNSPPFNRYATDEIRNLRARLRAHEQEAQARRMRTENNIGEEFELISRAAQFWMEAYRGNPYIDEQARHLETIAARLEELLPDADEALKTPIETEIVEIWVRLIARLEYDEKYIAKCEELDEKSTATLREAIAQGNEGRMLLNLDYVLQLRRQLYAKDTFSEKRINSMREFADTCEKLLPQAKGQARAFIAESARKAWYDLLDFGHTEAAEAGIERLKARAETILRSIGTGQSQQQEELRREAVRVLLLFYKTDIERVWADERLRKLGEHYTKAFEAACRQKNPDAQIETHKSSAVIWRAIRRRHPTDPQAEDNLNRMAEAVRIFQASEESR